jgi:hypothetical protein
MHGNTDFERLKVRAFVEVIIYQQMDMCILIHIWGDRQEAEIANDLEIMYQPNWRRGPCSSTKISQISHYKIRQHTRIYY